MYLLQAAIGFGMLLFLVFGIFVFIGIPLIANLLIRLFSRRMIHVSKRKKITIWISSIVLSSIIVSLLLYLIWTFALSKVDLTYSW